VYVRNKSRRMDWPVLVSTDTQITEEEIIRIYGKRWDIEVFSRYMMLLVVQRENEDDKTICELCFCLPDEWKISSLAIP